MSVREWRKAWRKQAKQILGIRRIVDLPSSVVLWAGPSQLDGTPIMAVAMRAGERSSDNRKTGDMIQVAIMRQDVSPAEAYAAGLDGAVCPEDCVHISKARGGWGTCYVNKVKLRAAWERAARLVKAGEIGAPAGFFRGAYVRIGNEGDGAAVPLHIWNETTEEAAGHTAYTAAWRDLGPGWSRLFMASVSSPADALRARSKGWRFFASSMAPSQDAGLAEISGLCPSDSHGLSCLACRKCDGTDKGEKRPSVWIPGHGITGAAFRREAE